MEERDNAPLSPTPGTEGERDYVPGEGPSDVRPATRKQRIVAAVAAVVVILITLAYTYALATGHLFSW